MISKKENFPCLAPETLTIRLSDEKIRILREWASITLGQIAAAAGFLAGMRLLTQYVRPDIFGTVSLLLGISTLVTTILCSPFIEAGLRFYPDAARNGQVPLLREIINAYLLKSARALMPALGIVGLFLVHMKNIPFLLVILSLCGLLTVDAIKTKERNFLNADRKQKTLAVWLATDTWARFLAAIAMVLVFGSSAESVLSGYFVGSLIILIYFQRNTGQPSVSNYESKDEILSADIRRYALPIIPAAIVGWITSLSDRYIIGTLAGLEQVGIYAAAYGLVSRPFLIAGGVIEQTLRPVYFDAISAGDKEREKKAFFALLAITVSVSFCLVVIITLLRREIAGLLLAKKYRFSAGLMPWIAMGYAFLVISYVFEKICYAYKRTKAISLVQTAGAIASLCTGIPLIYYYGIRGASISVPIYFGIQLVASVVISKRILKQFCKTAKKA